MTFWVGRTQIAAIKPVVLIRGWSLFLVAFLGIFWQPTSAVAQQQVLVHVLTPGFNPGGDTLAFGIGVYEVLNLQQVQQGSAAVLRFRQVQNAIGLSVYYRVQQGQVFLRKETVQFSPGLTIRVPVTNWDGRGSLSIQVGAVNNGDWTDVTAQVNQIPSGHRLPYGQAQIARARIKRADLGYLTDTFRWMRASMKKGGAISYVLFVVFVWGLFVSSMYIGRLFLSPHWAIKRIRSIGQAVASTSDLWGWNKGTDVQGVGEAVVVALTRRASRVERQLQKGVVKIKDLRAFEQEGSRLAEAVSYELIGARLSIDSKRRIRYGIRYVVNALPLSLESLWNAAVLAPLLGLLGTVMGISSAFQGVRLIAAMHDPAMAMSELSRGINRALYTTVHGLIVGILLMLVFYVCTRRARKIRQEIRVLGEKVFRIYLLELAKRGVRVSE